MSRSGSLWPCAAASVPGAHLPRLCGFPSSSLRFPRPRPSTAALAAGGPLCGGPRCAVRETRTTPRAGHDTDDISRAWEWGSPGVGKPIAPILHSIHGRQEGFRPHPPAAQEELEMPGKLAGGRCGDEMTPPPPTPSGQPWGGAGGVQMLGLACIRFGLEGVRMVRTASPTGVGLRATGVSTFL